jgi:hypothetical protein
MPEVIYRPGSKSPQARIEARLGNLSASLGHGAVQETCMPTRTVTTIFPCGTQAGPATAEPNEVDNG